jgi:hypothetical protein
LACVSCSKIVPYFAPAKVRRRFFFAISRQCSREPPTFVWFYTVGLDPIEKHKCADVICRIAKTQFTKKRTTIMKHTTLLLTFLSIAALTVGCKEQTTSQQIEHLKADTKEAAQDLKEKDYTFAQKAEFTEKMQSQLAEINKDLDLLAAKIEKSSDAVKAEAAPKLQALRDQAAQLNKQLDEAKNATESTWDSVKAGASKSYAALKDSFQQSRQWVSDKIAP